MINECLLNNRIVFLNGEVNDDGIVIRYPDKSEDYYRPSIIIENGMPRTAANWGRSDFAKGACCSYEMKDKLSQKILKKERYCFYFLAVFLFSLWEGRQLN